MLGQGNMPVLDGPRKAIKLSKERNLQKLYAGWFHLHNIWKDNITETEDRLAVAGGKGGGGGSGGGSEDTGQ